MRIRPPPTKDLRVQYVRTQKHPNFFYNRMTDIIPSPTYSQQTLALARDMYFSKISPTDIAKELDININDLGLMIFGSDKSGRSPDCWYQQSFNVEPDAIGHYVAAKRYVLSQVEVNLSKKIVEGAKELAEDKSRTLSLDEMKTASAILKDIDNMNRLERGEATSITESYHGYTLREIKNGKPIKVENEYDRTSEEESDEEGIEEASFQEIPKPRGNG